MSLRAADEYVDLAMCTYVAVVLGGDALDPVY